MALRTGALRHRINIQKYTETRDAQGGPIKAWATENTVWANVNPIGALERAQGDQTKAVRTHRITMKFYSPGITAADRIIFKTREFGIVAVINQDERGCRTILDVKEAEVSDG